jgi:hypothetical protein
MADNEFDNVTTFDIVANGYKPAVPTSDTEFVEDAIDEAEMILESKLGDLTAWIDRGATEVIRGKRKRKLQRVVTRMVRRVMRNPSGFASETDGDYSYARPSALASGEIYVGPAEWSLLGVATRTFGTIRVGLPQDSPRNMHGHLHRRRR